MIGADVRLELERTAVAVQPDRQGVAMSRSPMTPLPWNR
jgi:hypothetical protein